MKAYRLVTMAGLTLLAIGCAGDSKAPKGPQALREMPLPPAPPVVTPSKSEPLDLELREAAKREVRTASLSAEAPIRANAIEAAQVGLGTESHPIIAKGLGDAEPAVRFAAAMGAGSLQLKDLHHQLVALADDPNPRVRVAARYALHRIGDKTRSHDLEKAARDANPRVRRDTAYVLGHLEEPSGAMLLRQMSTDLQTDVRFEVASSLWLLARDQWAVEMLVAGAVGKFADDQMICILALAGPKDRRVESHIRGKLTDPYTEVQLVAARALGDLGYDDGYTIAMNNVRSTDPRQRVLSAMALGSIGRRDAQSALGGLLKDTDARVRLAAAMALLQLKEQA